MKMGYNIPKLRKCNERRTQKFIAINTNIEKIFQINNLTFHLGKERKRTQN